MPRDLATMAATLANGGVNPVTKKKVVSPETVMHTLSVMATAGLYDDSGSGSTIPGCPLKAVWVVVCWLFVQANSALPSSLPRWMQPATA